MVIGPIHKNLDAIGMDDRSETVDLTSAVGDDRSSRGEAYTPSAQNSG